MPRRYIFVTGGVVSGLGKGITASSLGRLLKSRGFQVTMQKFDPYLNIDPGTMNPCQHGEVFVTDDGAETDLDLGHYERFIDEALTRNSNVTTGQVYLTIIEKERRGAFLGGTVQVIPHVTNEIKSRIRQDEPPAGVEAVTIIEVGGTVGDIESQPFLEAIRQFQRERRSEGVIIIHTTLVPYLKVSQEIKTKPTQASVKQLQMLGLWPDIVVCRSERPLDDSVCAKIALFCNVSTAHVIQNIDLAHLYEAPLMLERNQLAAAVFDCWRMPAPPVDLSDWERVVEVLQHPRAIVRIALVGKYTNLHDSYISVVEALKHGGIAHGVGVQLLWIDAEEIDAETAAEKLADANGLIVPGGFGDRGSLGMMAAIKYARTRKLPFLGICLGMQLAVVEFARNVIGWDDANSTEFNPETGHPVIDILPDKAGGGDIGGTLRRGAYPCVLKPGTRAVAVYGEENISERHRHRYEVNNQFREELSAAGLVLSGTSPDGHIVEMIEIADHPYFVGTQAHPEFKSRPNRPHPLFAALVGNSLHE
jgi:CTP synthase